MTVTVSDSGILFNDGSLQPTALTTGTQTIAGAKTFSSNVTLTAGVQGALVLGTAQNTTSGTAIDFTGIPSWVRRITVMLNGVSSSGTSNLQAQLGSGSVQTSGYSGYVQIFAGSTLTNSGIVTTGFPVYTGAATDAKNGTIVFTLFGSNTWVANGLVACSASQSSSTTGIVTLSGVLDRIRLTTVNGTDTFDAGSVNIMYEG